MIEVTKLDNLTSGNIICHLRSQLARYGIHDELISDNGPRYASSTFTDFSKSYDFVHTTSSPHFPQANGEAERAVQTIKNLLKKAQDPYKALLNHRNTPLDGINLSPAQLLMGRRLKSPLPTKVELLKPQRSQEIQQHFQKRKKRVKFYYDQHSEKELPPLTPGDKVSMHHENEWIQAIVVNKHHTPRSYIVQTANGKFYRRNRRHLRMRVSQAKNKETDATQIAQPQKATLPTPTGIQSRPCRPGVTTNHYSSGRNTELELCRL